MIGAAIEFAVFPWYTSFHSNAFMAGKPWAEIEEYRRLPLAGGGAPA